jgi:predicted negative regulator of RcsB-dependent stress response
MGRRITRKQLKQDEFVSIADAVFRWLADNWRPVVLGVSAISIATLLWWAGDRWSSSRSDAASYALYQAVPPALGAPAADPGAEDGEEAKTKLNDVIDRHGRSDQADVARIYLARILIDEGDLEAGRDLLVDVMGRHSGDAIGRAAALDLVHIRIATGQGAEVAQELEAVVTGTDRRLPKDAALHQLGELYLREADSERAREYFQKLVDEFPESPYNPLARQRLGEIG